MEILKLMDLNFGNFPFELFRIPCPCQDAQQWGALNPKEARKEAKAEARQKAKLERLVKREAEKVGGGNFTPDPEFGG